MSMQTTTTLLTGALLLAAAGSLSADDWHLTGGFWGLTLEELADLLFRDRFEEE